MRVYLAPFLLLLASVAEARDCVAPQYVGTTDELRGLIAFSDCVLRKIAALEVENAALRRDLDEMRASLDGFPGELQNRNGRVTRQGGGQLTQASYVQTARTREAAVSLPVNPDALAALCGTGCSLSLALVGEGLRAADSAPVSAIGPCAFR